MANQPIQSKAGMPATTKPGMPAVTRPGMTSVRPALEITQVVPMWVPIMMVVVSAISVAALVLTILKAPEEGARPAGPRVNELNIANTDNAPVEEGKEVQVKIAELERNLATAKDEIRRLNEALIDVRSNVDGLNANVSIVQSQTSKIVPPVNIQAPQPEIKN